MPRASTMPDGLTDTWGRRNRRLVDRPCPNCGAMFRPAHPDLHGRIMPTKDGHTTGPLHWVPERHTWTDPQMSDEWRPDGTSMLYPGGGDLDVGPEPLRATVAVEAVNLADEMARRAVEGEQTPEQHPIGRMVA